MGAEQVSGDKEIRDQDKRNAEALRSLKTLKKAQNSVTSVQFSASVFHIWRYLT